MLLSACQKQETENNVPKGALLLSAEEFVDHNGQKTSDDRRLYALWDGILQ